MRASRYFPLRELRERIAYAHSKGIEIPLRVLAVTPEFSVFDVNHAMRWMMALPKAPERWRISMDYREK